MKYQLNRIVIIKIFISFVPHEPNNSQDTTHYTPHITENISSTNNVYNKTTPKEKKLDI